MSQTVDGADTTHAERIRTVMSALSQGLSGEAPLNDMQLRDVGRALDELERAGVINPVEKGAMSKAVYWSSQIAPFIANKDSSEAELYRSATLNELGKIESSALTSSPHFAGARKTLQDIIPPRIERVAEERFKDAQTGFAEALNAIKRGDLSGADARRDQVTAALDDSLRYEGGEQGYVKMALAAAALASDPSKGVEAYHAYAHLIRLQKGIDDHDAKHPGERLLTAENRKLLESVEQDIVKRLNITMDGNSIVLPDGSRLPVGSEKMAINPVDGTYGYSSNQLKPYETLLSEMEYLRDSFAKRGNVSLGAGPVDRYHALEVIGKIDALREAVKEGDGDRAAYLVRENGLQKYFDNPGSLTKKADELTATDARHDRFFKNAHALMEATGWVPAVAASKIMQNIMDGQRKGLGEGEITKNFAVDLVSELGVKKLTGAASTMGGKAMAEFTRNVVTEFAKDPSTEGMAKALGNSFYKAVTGTITKDAVKSMSSEEKKQLFEFLVDAASKLGATNAVKPYLESVFPRAKQDAPGEKQSIAPTGDGSEPLVRTAALNAASTPSIAEARVQPRTDLDSDAPYKMTSAAIEKSGVLRDSPLADHKDDVTAALALAVAKNKLDGIDSILLSKDGTRLIAVQGDPQSEFHKTATVTIQDAIRQPADQWLAQIAQLQSDRSADMAKQQAETIAIKPPSESENRGGAIAV